MAVTMGWMSEQSQASFWQAQRIMSKPAVRLTQHSVQRVPGARACIQPLIATYCQRCAAARKAMLVVGCNSSPLLSTVVITYFVCFAVICWFLLSWHNSGFATWPACYCRCRWRGRSRFWLPHISRDTCTGSSGHISYAGRTFVMLQLEWHMSEMYSEQLSPVLGWTFDQQVVFILLQSKAFWCEIKIIWTIL